MAKDVPVAWDCASEEYREMAYNKMAVEIANLRQALHILYVDCADYIRLNNLYRADGQSAVFNQTMQQAAKVLGLKERA